MKHQQHRRASKTVRLTIDFPAEQHAYLKMVAARKGISMREYVIESLSKNAELEEAKHTNLSDNKFKKLLKKTADEHDDVLKRLSDK